MSAAPWASPPAVGTTFWHVSDTHMDSVGYVWTKSNMVNAGIDVSLHEDQWFIKGKIHTGDITDDGAAIIGQDAEAITWLNTYMGSATDIWVMGNHDMIGPQDRTGAFRTRAQWEAVYGRSTNSSTYVGDPGKRIRIVAVATDKFLDLNATGGIDLWKLSEATLTWLDTQLSADQSTPTFIACHYMLRFQGDFEVGSRAQPEDRIAQIVGAHPQVVGWLCGHAHWQVTTSYNTVAFPFANRSAFVAISAPSTGIYPPGSRAFAGPSRSFVITYRDTDRIEVRFRDHGSRKWITGNGGNRVKILASS